MSDSYQTVLEVVAENPATSVDEIVEIARTRNVAEETATDLLEKALESGDVMEADQKHWIVRKREFGFHEYDHPAN